eukprot:TRINITY_DN3408_c0_g1_i1.p1 TRINITY_DN3408_c0_g1~~TRINITY_DN3408_c0_g1_i1.p1  ORF type:complete len:517 (-),score=125.41 TRINITY_DN3408_c0_g1_i1:332-1720(-)
MSDPVAPLPAEPPTAEVAPPPPAESRSAAPVEGVPTTPSANTEPSRSSASACTLVVKSLPFHLTVAAITSAISERVTVPPTSVAPVRDHCGVFRGTAFVSFASLADANAAAEALTGAQIGSRRIIVERVRESVSAAAKEKELRRAALAKGVSAEAVDAMEAFVLSFVRSPSSATPAADAPTSSVVDRPLSSAERRYVHARAGSLGLVHLTVPWGDSESERTVEVEVKTAGVAPSAAADAGDCGDGGAAAEVAAMATANSKKGKKKKMKVVEEGDGDAVVEADLPPLIKGRPDVMALARTHKLSGPNESYVAPVKGEVRAEDLKGIKFFRPRSAAAAAAAAAGAGGAAKAVAGAAAPPSAAFPMAQPAATKVPLADGRTDSLAKDGADGILVQGGHRQWYAPPRQPTGPDGTLGFHAARAAAEAALEKMKLVGEAGGFDGSDTVGDQGAAGGSGEEGGDSADA